jgi:hypothetical protein
MMLFDCEDDPGVLSLLYTGMKAAIGNIFPTGSFGNKLLPHKKSAVVPRPMFNGSMPVPVSREWVTTTTQAKPTTRRENLALVDIKTTSPQVLFEVYFDLLSGSSS